MQNNSLKRIIDMPFGKLVINSKENGNLGENVLGENKYSSKFSNESFTINFEKTEDDSKEKNYRQKMFEKGLYLGHHLGLPADLQLGDSEKSIYVKNGNKCNYEKILWSYSLKYILTVMALKNDALHLKGSTIIKDNLAYLLIS